MKCSKCGAQNEDNEMFCNSCGAELYTGENVKEEKKPEKKSGMAFGIGKGKNKKPKKASDDKKTEGNAAEKKTEGKASDKKLSAEERKKNAALRIKLIAGAVAVVAVVIVIVIVAGSIGSTKGSKIADKVPLGRNIDYCIKETGEDFASTSQYKDMKSVANFDYICESDKTVNISGITVPRWAVLVTEDSSRILDTVEYYDFSSLKNGWKGEHSNIRFNKETVSYGMDMKTVNKTIGFTPYYTKKTSDNKSLNCYRYYIVDNDTGTERVFNYYVEFNDVNGTVVNAYDTEINYVNYVLGIK